MTVTFHDREMILKLENMRKKKKFHCMCSGEAPTFNKNPETKFSKYLCIVTKTSTEVFRRSPQWAFTTHTHTETERKREVY